MKVVKYKLLAIIYISLLTCIQGYAMTLYEGDKGVVDILANTRGFYNTDADLAYYIDESLYYQYDFSEDWSFGYNLSAMYDQSYERDVYRIVGENYISVSSTYLGMIDIGSTPTVYYNGFLAGWLDWGFSGGYEIIDSNRNGDYLALRNASRSVFYTYQLRNMKIAMQVSGHDYDDYLQSPVGGTRNYGFGSGFVYALGILQFSTSYIVTDYDRADNVMGDKDFSKTQVFDAGFKMQYANIYSVLGFFYDKNRWNLGNESIAINYILRYDNQKKKKWVPQLIYGVREYVTTGINSNNDEDITDNLMSDNFLYLSLAHYYNYHFSVYMESKIDMRRSSQINKATAYGVTTKDARDNMIGIGLSYELF